MKGDFPSSENEIAIDRMYADNNHLSVGDTLKSDSHEWTITGLVALPDYSCLFQNNNDSMFDSVKFGVAVVTPEAFSKFEVLPSNMSTPGNMQKNLPLIKKKRRFPII